VAVSNGVPLIWRDPWQSLVAGGFQYATAPQHPAAEWTYSERLVARADLPDLAGRANPADSAAHAAGETHAVGETSTLGGTLVLGEILVVAGTLALEALRVAAWRPRFATEVDARSLPHELDWLRSAVHLSKGCYRGQETVAKVHNLGHPPRRLVLLHLDGSEGQLPVAGDEVSLGDKVVGRVTTVALHYELGPIALAVVKRSVDPTAELIVVTGALAGSVGADSDADSDAGSDAGSDADSDAGSDAGSGDDDGNGNGTVSDGIRIAASQEVIVPTDAGAAVNVPRLPRLGAVTR
jgi:folate-binding protein YgfZ